MGAVRCGGCPPPPAPHLAASIEIRAGRRLSSRCRSTSVRIGSSHMSPNVLGRVGQWLSA
ncbi:hypothetical protein [Oryza sativa Japonica Group]|uniref:Uncharacterized protein n=2 Tax=Oryza sativa subsp. japonica TaxID=39947 RepID=Q5NA08_ORYSJ|nr:hypothetical protein [Oryza sativa Japonica Group]BAD81751.1 hypothetical protein [Oryza sativa Japonica Group]